MANRKNTSGEAKPLELLRERVHKTQLQVAFDVGVSPKTVGSWEKGAIPHFDKAVKLASSLNVSLDELCEAFGMEVPNQDKDA